MRRPLFLCDEAQERRWQAAGYDWPAARQRWAEFRRAWTAARDAREANELALAHARAEQQHAREQGIDESDPDFWTLIAFTKHLLHG